YYSYTNPGLYNANLIVNSDYGCADTTTKIVTVYQRPTLVSSHDTLICLGDTAFLSVSGAELYNWYPNYNLDNNLSATPQAFPAITTSYQVEAVDSNNCFNYALVIVKVQQQPFVQIADTTVIIGESVTLDATSDEISNYYWSSAYDISCTSCSIIEVKPTERTVFNLSYSDTSNCFTLNKDIIIDIIEAYTVDVPNAFTPNGDGVNDVIYVRGWGIKELVDFKIFNRFGELIFISNNISNGWDGTNTGSSQNIETFTYQVSVLTYDDHILTKTGTIKLLK
ncbi:MAG: gliding motility-associated C-terminal domain-containing protein, partial [Chloroflexia bacterium]|nr:gliding motility-associated C-terminal domain-containing protein [Chloroflexia bacterium]